MRSALIMKSGRYFGGKRGDVAMAVIGVEITYRFKRDCVYGRR